MYMQSEKNPSIYPQRQRPFFSFFSERILLWWKRNVQFGGGCGCCSCCLGVFRGWSVRIFFCWFGLSLLPLYHSVFWRISKASDNLLFFFMILKNIPNAKMFHNGKVYSICCPVSQLFKPSCKANRTLQIRCLGRFLFSHKVHLCMSRVNWFSVNASYM